VAAKPTQPEPDVDVNERMNEAEGMHHKHIIQGIIEAYWCYGAIVFNSEWRGLVQLPAWRYRGEHGPRYGRSLGLGHGDNA
jgi:hypothetical protein